MFEKKLLKYTIIIQSSPFAVSHSGYFFTKKLLERSQKVDCVFFFNEGVLISNSNLDFPVDEKPISLYWQKLQQEYNINLLVCSSSAMRRGVNEKNILPEFKLASISQLLQSSENSDRVVSFT